MSSGIETNDLDDSLPAPSPSTSATTEPSDAASDTEQESGAHTVKQRRDLLQAKLNGHRHDRLKRKLPAETQWLNALEEDQRVLSEDSPDPLPFSCQTVSSDIWF
uniref:Uncharacterized protein n=1 Tax=Knipowitschia caucasica TaxID=637954 RepID=A0AAV2KR54_KNICA